MSEYQSINIPSLAMPEILPLAESALNFAEADAILQWSREYLCKAHRELGRSGPVCPFVPRALKKQLLFATIYEEQYGLEPLKTILLDEMKRFIALEPVSGNDAQYKSLMVIFPALATNNAVELIDQAQAQLQKYFVPNGLMVGEFHPAPPEKRGLWNTEFRPLYSPVPMLVIRHMVATDLLFLDNSAELFYEYVKIFGNLVPERFKENFALAAEKFGISSPAISGHEQGAPRVMASLIAENIDHKVYCHDDFTQPIRAPKDFAQALDYCQERITKSLFLRSHDTGKFCLVVCAVNHRMDLKQMAAELNIKRLELASLEELQQYVGYPPTSVTPIALDNIAIFIDEKLMEYATVLTGSGVPRIEIELSPRDLLSLSKAKLMRLS